MNRDLPRSTALTLLLACLCAGQGWGAPAIVLAAPQADEKKAADQPAEAKKPEEPPQAPAKALAAKVAAEKAEANAKVKAQAAAMVPQWLQQFRPILMTELTFIRQMCDLPKEQRPKIKAAGEASLQDAATKFAQFQQGRRAAGAASPQPHPRTIIREGLAQALKESLTPEQMALYTEEAAARAAQHKRAAILSVVSRLDGVLCLTANQREEITGALSSHWQAPWENWLMIHQYGPQYFPQVPDEHLVAHLNDEQKAVWKSLQKIDAANTFFGGQVVENQDDADWWNNEPAKPLPAAVKLLERWFKGNR